MPLRMIRTDRMEPGTIVRKGDGPAFVVSSVELSVKGQFTGKYVHDMRRATEEEQLASDVMQS